MSMCYPLLSTQSCLTLCNPMDSSPPGSSVHGNSPGKNTGVGCHFLLQCMKVKSESEVAQSCRTLSDPMDCRPPGSSVHGIFQARVLEWSAIAFSRTQAYYTRKSPGYHRRTKRRNEQRRTTKTTEKQELKCQCAILFLVLSLV